jgi:hypothetical protein
MRLISPIFFIGIFNFSLQGFFNSEAHGLTSAKEIKSPVYTDCERFSSFKETYEFIEVDQDLNLSPSTSMQIAMEVSKGCEGASQRFQKVFKLLKKVGVDYKKSIELALQFAYLDDSRTENFVQIFSKTYLENYFNFDFKNSFEITFNLSKELKDQPEVVRNDFIKLTQFCMKTRELALPVPVCAKMILELVASAPYYPQGIYPYFEDTFYFSKVDLKMNLTDSLKTTLKILKQGPKAFENFKNTHNYLTQKINLKKKDVIKLSHAVAEHSVLIKESESK